MVWTNSPQANFTRFTSLTCLKYVLQSGEGLIIWKKTLKKHTHLLTVNRLFIHVFGTASLNVEVHLMK